MLTQKLMELTIAGGTEWVMVLLLVLSLLSVSVMIERGVFFRRRRRRLDRLDRSLMPLIETEQLGELQGLVREIDDPALSMAAATTQRRDREAVEKMVASALGRDRLQLERRLAFLGTLGNNAPFIGLFGTVLGIIRAFNDLSLDSKAGSSAVMAGISEALVATAIGLFVAIPAVIAYNYFQRQVDRTLAITESLAQAIIAGVPSSAPQGEGVSPEPGGA